MNLRIRIIGLITLFAIVLIASFTVLLLNRQLEIVTENNKYRARVGTFSAKGAFERALLLDSPTGDPAKAFQKLMPLLKEGHLVEEVSIVDLKGKIVASTYSFLVGTTLSDREMEPVQYAQKIYSDQSWFTPEINAGELALYTPIILKDAPQYVAILRYSLGNMGEAIQQIRQLCALVAVGVLVSVIPLCLLLIGAILGPIRILNLATKEVAAGNLSLKVSVPTGDELGELAQTFNDMTSALNRMKQRAENTNPLTKLPGNNVIREVLEKRLQAEAKFIAIYVDLDNFKAFNDKYGIGKGDQAIQLTAGILREAIKFGSPTDFLGHEGGDDFIILTTPEKVESITSYVCTEFDKKIKDLYPVEDRDRGSTIPHDREGNVKQFPLLTVSLAGVTNLHRNFTSYAEVTNVWAEVKNKAKSVSKTGGKSSFYVDHRTAQEPTAPTSSIP